jgi:hypothetical protein
MLAALLLDLMGLNRWEVLLRALSGVPCTGRYVLTGQGKIDRVLSHVLNRAWLGDGGGALAVAAGQEWTGGYDNAHELLADVSEAIGT